MQSICLVTCYMGALPNYFSYFAASCKKNPSIHFLVFNDTIPKTVEDGNLKIVKLDLKEFNQLASEKLSLRINISDGYKIADLKPAYGFLFAEYLTGFDFWGYCDLDIIWGNIRRFVTPDLLKTYDVITTKEKWISGHFTIFKNNPLTISLFKTTEDYKAIFEDSKFNWFFEESCRRWEGVRYSLQELAENNLTISIYDIINHKVKEGLLTVYSRDVIREYPHKPINYLYKQGSFVDLNDNNEFMYYHLLAIKKLWRFYIPEYKPIPESLHITAQGIRDIAESPIKWSIKRLFNSYKGARKSLQKQRTGDIFRKLVKRTYSKGDVE